MNGEPLISAEVFDYLRKLGIAPYTQLNDMVREQLGDGVRLLSLFAGDEFVTRKAGLRITVISGQVNLAPAGLTLDLNNTREHTRLTQAGENRLVAQENAVVLLAESDFLDLLSSWTELAAYASQTEDADVVKRLLSIRHTLAFQRLPLEHVIEALKQMTPRQVKAGEVIVTQGERGDAFYLIWSGKAEIWKTGIYDDEAQLVAVIGAKEAFGDEALVMSGNRNATVKMIEDGELLVMGEDAFRALLATPLVQEVEAAEVATLMDQGWQPVDVRYAEEFEDGHLPGAIHLPLPELRAQAEALLDKQNRYIAVCLSGKRSAVGAFLLKQRGYDVVAMKGGMSCWEGETVAP